eukprot:jgi/Mesvir1/29008/Mv17775-RA.1
MSRSIRQDDIVSWPGGAATSPRMCAARNGAPPFDHLPASTCRAGNELPLQGQRGFAAGCCPGGSWRLHGQVSGWPLVVQRKLSRALGSLPDKPAPLAPSPLGRDRILLEGLLFHGYHGVLPEERSLGQKFRIDLTLYTPLLAAGAADDLNLSVDYAAVYQGVRSIVEGPPHALVESLAHAIAGRVLGRFPSVTDVMVRVRKPHVAVQGVVDGLGVEIWRSRQG